MYNERRLMYPLFDEGEIVGIRMDSKSVKTILGLDGKIFTDKIVGKIIRITPGNYDGDGYSYSIDIGATSPSVPRVIVVRKDDICKLPGKYRSAIKEFDDMVLYKADPPIGIIKRKWYGIEEFKSFVDDRPTMPEFYRGRKIEGKSIADLIEESIIQKEVDKAMNTIQPITFQVPTSKEVMNAMFGLTTGRYEYKKIIFSGPCTIIIWEDGTKTVARASKDKFGNQEPFDPEKGVAICFMKRVLGETKGKKVLREAAAKYGDLQFKECLKTVEEYCGEGITIKEYEDSDIAD